MGNKEFNYIKNNSSINNNKNNIIKYILIKN